MMDDDDAAWTKWKKDMQSKQEAVVALRARADEMSRPAAEAEAALDAAEIAHYHAPPEHRASAMRAWEAADARFVAAKAALNRDLDRVESRQAVGAKARTATADARTRITQRAWEAALARAEASPSSRALQEAAARAWDEAEDATHRYHLADDDECRRATAQRPSEDDVFWVLEGDSLAPELT